MKTGSYLWHQEIAEDRVDHMESIGAAIIGCGAIAPIHAKAIRGVSLAALKIVMDIRPDRAKALADSFGCEFTTDINEVWERRDIGVIHICTPHYLHAPLAKAALRAGKHVLIEKPVAMRPSEARDLAKVAEASGLQAGVVLQNRYNESSRRIKDLVLSGELGPLRCMKGMVTWSRSAPYYTESGWRGTWEMEGGGVLINQAIHTLDLLLWLSGSPPISVKGMVSTDTLEGMIEVEDSVHAAISFANGSRGLFYATNSYLADRPVELEFVFKDGILQQRNDFLYLTREDQERLLSSPPALTDGSKSYWGSSHGLLINDFYRCLMEGRRFPFDIAEGSKVLDVIFAIYASSMRGRQLAPGCRLPPSLEEESAFYEGMMSRHEDRVNLNLNIDAMERGKNHLG